MHYSAKTAKRDFRTLEARGDSAIRGLRSLEIGTRYAQYAPLFDKVRTAPNLDELELVVLKLEGALLREKAIMIGGKNKPLGMSTDSDVIESNFPLLRGTDKLETARILFRRIEESFKNLKAASESSGNMGSFKLPPESIAG